MTSYLDYATGRSFTNRSKPKNHEKLKTAYVGHGSNRIGFSGVPLSVEHLNTLFKTQDYYIFIDVNPKETPVDENYNYIDKLKNQQKKMPNLGLKVEHVDFEEFSDPASITKIINKMYHSFSRKKSIVFISNDPHKHSAFVFGCYLSFSYPDKDEYEIFNAINDLDNIDKETLQPQFLTEETRQLLTEFIRANNVRHHNFIQNKTKAKREKEERKRKLLSKYEIKLDEYIDEVFQESGLNIELTQ